MLSAIKLLQQINQNRTTKRQLLSRCPVVRLVALMLDDGRQLQVIAWWVEFANCLMRWTCSPTRGVQFGALTDSHPVHPYRVDNFCPGERKNLRQDIVVAASVVVP